MHRKDENDEPGVYASSKGRRPLFKASNSREKDYNFFPTMAFLSLVEPFTFTFLESRRMQYRIHYILFCNYTRNIKFSIL